MAASNPATWAKVAVANLDHLRQYESKKLLTEIGKGAGLAIVLGNILDTIPGGLVIGAAFNARGTLSLALILGMFLGGIPEAAASAALLRKAGYSPKTIFALWSVVPVAGKSRPPRGRSTCPFGIAGHGIRAALAVAGAPSPARDIQALSRRLAGRPPTVAGDLRILSRTGRGTPVTGPPSPRRRAPPNSLEGPNSACGALMRACLSRRS